MIGKKTLWEKEKMLVTSIFSFPTMFSKAFICGGHENQGLFGKGLIKSVIVTTKTDHFWRQCQSKHKSVNHDCTHTTVVSQIYGMLQSALVHMTDGETLLNNLQKTKEAQTRAITKRDHTPQQLLVTKQINVAGMQNK